MKIFGLWISALLIAFSVGAQEVLTIAKGQRGCSIFLPDRAGAPEQTAAELLQRYLKQMTGVNLPVCPESAAKDGRGIFVGHTNVAKTILKGEPLIPDEIAIRSGKDQVVLCGGGSRGTLYAAHTFLERLGVRWWTGQVETIPHRDSIEIPEMEIRQRPAFALRWCVGKDTSSSIRFNVSCRNNQWMRIPASWGGHYQNVGFCHTFERLIPPAEFEKHPDWFWLRKGKRQGKKVEGSPYTHQLCLSNPELRKELVKRVLALADQNPSADSISVTPNDSWDYERGCECAACQQMNRQYGSPAGPLILLLNEVAAAVSVKYPSMKLETLAYRYTRKPPKEISLHPNVMICLCDIECDFSKPLSHAANADFSSDLKGWTALTPNVRVWHYTSNFTNPFIPHPALLNAAEDLRFLQTFGVKGIFFENMQAAIGDFGELAALRTYVVSRLMWDPALDQEALIMEFLKGYYGSAAPYLRTYINLMAQAVNRAGIKLECFRKSADDWLTVETMAEAWNLLDQAEESVASDANLLERVKVFRHPLNVAMICRYAEADRKFRLPPRYGMVHSAIELAKKHGMSKDLVKQLQRLLAKDAP